MANPAAEARARVLAAHPEAVVVERGRNSIKHRLFDAPDGRQRFALDCAIGPLHCGPDADLEIDTAFAPSTAPWQWEMTHAGFEVRALSRLDAGQVIEYRDGQSGEWVRFQPHALQYSNALDQIQPIAMPGAVDAEVEDDTLTWPDGYGPGVSISWQAQTARLAKRLTIDSPSDLPPVEQYILDGGEPVLELNFIFAFSSGITPYVNGQPWGRGADREQRETQGLVEFRDGDGNVLWWFNLPRSWDAEGEEQLGTFRFKKVGNALYVSHRVPLGFVQGAAYPLVVDVDIDPQPAQVGTGADDTRRQTGTGGFDSSASRHMVGWGDAAAYLNMHASDRFTGISGLSGATIDVSYVEKYGYGNGQGSPQTKLYADDRAAPLAPTDATEFDALPLTTAGADWDANSVNNAWGTSPSLNSVLQELVDEHDPSAIQIVHKNNGVSSGYHYQDWDSYEANSSPAKLHIEYTAAGGVAHEGSAALSGAGALSCIATVALVAAAALSGVGSLSADGRTGVAHEAAASLSGQGTVSAAGALQAAGAAALSGEGTLTAAGEIVGKVEGEASLSGQGTLTAAGMVEAAGAASLSGQGSLAASGLRERTAGASLAGEGTLSAGAVKGLHGEASLSGQGGLTSKATVSYAAVASLSGEGVLTVKSVVLYAGAASLSGEGTLTADGRVVVPGEAREGAAVLSGTGTLTASAVVFAIRITDLAASYEPILALAASYKPVLALAASYKPIIELEASVA